MLVALLSAVERAGDGASCPRAFLLVGGRTVIERQASLALALGCERIVCVAEGLPPELIQLQHQVERSGARFHAIGGRQALHGLVSAADEVLILTDGVVPDKDRLLAIQGSRKGVIALPAEAGLAEGYERIDRDWCWAGAARCSGSEVERLSDLPPDVDLLAALMRCTLQAGRPIIPLPDEALPGGQWWLVSNATTALAAGRAILSQGYRPSRWSAPGNALIDRVVLRHADDLLRRSVHRLALWGVSAVALLGAASATYLGEASWALFALLLSSIALRALVVLQRVASEAATPASQVLEVIPDLALLLVFLLLEPAAPGGGTLYPLLVLVVGLHICCRLNPELVQDFGAERPMLLILLILACSVGELSFALQVLSLAVLGVNFAVLGRDRLTRA